MGIMSILWFFVDPFHILRNYFINPVFSLTWSVFNYFREKTRDQVNTARDFGLKLGVVGFLAALIIWSAVFMYVAFYYAYMPAISHTRPVHMQFKTCLDSGGPCSFPHAHISLTKKQQLLMVGQAYKVMVNIDMPESPQNQELGMFMVCAEMRDHESLLRGHSCRSAMLRYRSSLIRTLTTWALSPLYVLGLKEEYQKVPVEIFPQYLEERQHPITDVYVEIQSHKIQFYTVTLHITADFTGLRYIMFNWPVLSAAIGVTSNLLFLLIVFLISWYHWSDTSWIKARVKYRQRRRKMVEKPCKKDSKKTAKKISDDEESGGKDEFFDDEDLSVLDDESLDIEEFSASQKSDYVVSATSGSEGESKSGVRKRTPKAKLKTDDVF